MLVPTILMLLEWKASESAELPPDIPGSESYLLTTRSHSKLDKTRSHSRLEARRSHSRVPEEYN